MSWGELRFLPETGIDAKEAASYYEEQECGLGVRFKKEISKVVESIALNPLIRRERKGGFRRANLPSFPYYIAYQLSKSETIIIAIAHSSRHPDFWKNRI
jgi:plasmid stabilization system protein ParE